MGSRRASPALVADDNRLTAQSGCDSIAEVMIDEELIENDIRIIARLEIHFCIKAALYVGGIIDLSFYIQADTAVPLISGACVLVLVTHTAIAGEGKVSYLLFKIGNTDTQIGEFVSIFAGKSIESASLLSIQLIFLSEHAGNDLSQFVTGDVSFTFEEIGRAHV